MPRTSSTHDNCYQQTPASQRTRGMVALARFIPVSPLRKTGLLTALLILCFIFNAGSSMAQTPDDHGNTSATATALTLGTTVTGVIDPIDDEDVFTFEIPVGIEVIDVWIYTEGSISDTMGGLFNSSLNQIAFNDDNPLSATSSHFYMGASLTPGTYYVLVSGNGEDTGAYSLHTMTGEDQGDIREESSSIDVGATADGIIGSPRDSDLFKIELSTRADIVMYTSGIADTVGILYDYRGVRLTANDNSSMSEDKYEFFIGDSLEPGTYYIEVLAYELGPYRLHVEQVADQDADRSQATELALDSSELGFINHRNDEDYFIVNVPEATDVWVYAVGPTDTVGELQDSSGNRLAYNDDSELSSGRSSFFMAKNLQAGTHYLEVSGYAGYRGPYRVFATEVPDTGDAMATADSLELGIPQTGLIDPSTDIDLYELNLPFAAEVAVYTIGDVDTTGEILSSDGSTLTSLSTDDDSGTDLNFSMRHDLAPGTYYVRVGSYGSETGAYALFAEPVSQLTVDGPSLVRRIASGNDEEYFRLHMDTPGDVWIYGYGSLDTVGTLYDSDFNVISHNDDSLLSGRFRAFHLRESLEVGTYYVNVRSWGTGTGRFGIGAETIPDHGNDRLTATPLTLGPLVPGRIDSNGDTDYFRLDLEEKTNVFLYARTSTLTPLMGDVLDSNGEIVDVNVYQLTLARRLEDGFLVQDDFEAGTYYVRVTADSSVDYTLHARHDFAYNAFVAGCQGTTGDPLYACQWHLHNDEDINVEPAWADGINGTGINVAVVDDGLDHYHEDLRPNVGTSFNHDYSGGDDVHTPFDHHGTAVAGLIAARDNNVGVRGVAPRATIYAYNMLAFSTDAVVVDAMRRNQDVTAVYNNSWGFIDSPRLDPEGALWEAAVEAGVRKGYGGRGAFYAFAAGNGGGVGDDSNLSELTSFYAVTAVCAVGESGVRSSYSETGANLWVCAPSSDASRGLRGIVTTENSDRYDNSFGGTSAASPQVAGVAALLRHANRELTWRDVKLILAGSARMNDEENTGWEAGALQYGSSTERYHFNHEYGFGVVDAGAAVDMARDWVNVPPMESTEVYSGNLGVIVPDAASLEDTETATTSLTMTTDIGFAEFVEIDLNFSHPSFRDLEIELESPSGAVSTLVGSFESEELVPLFGEFRFGSAKHLGEDPNGQWTLRITDEIPGLTGTLESWTIKVYGHQVPTVPPSVDTIAPGPGSLTVAWSAPSFMRGGAITSYDLRYIPTAADESDDTNWDLLEGVWRTGDGALTAEITGLVGGMKYDVQVRAVNAQGPGNWSATATGVPAASTARCSGGAATSSPDLPNCAVLLSGLTIDRATLTPEFDPDHTAYTAVAEVSRITVTPANDHGAAFQFLDAINVEIADFDSSRAGHQVPLAIGENTVKVRVVSQDQAAHHVYTIVVTLADAVSRYDSDGNGSITDSEVLAAAADFFDNLISAEEVLTVIRAYFDN